jgi:hypothetical protein
LETGFVTDATRRDCPTARPHTYFEKRPQLGWLKPAAPTTRSWPGAVGRHSKKSSDTPGRLIENAWPRAVARSSKREHCVANLSDRFANFPTNLLRMLMSKTEMAERGIRTHGAISVPLLPSMLAVRESAQNRWIFRLTEAAQRAGQVPSWKRYYCISFETDAIVSLFDSCFGQI